MHLDREKLKNLIREELDKPQESGVEEELEEGSGAERVADRAKKAAGADFEAKGQAAALVNKLMDKFYANQQLVAYFSDITKGEPGSDRALVALAAFSTMLGVPDISKAYTKVRRFQALQKTKTK